MEQPILKAKKIYRGSDRVKWAAVLNAAFGMDSKACGDQLLAWDWPGYCLDLHLNLKHGGLLFIRGVHPPLHSTVLSFMYP